MKEAGRRWRFNFVRTMIYFRLTRIYLPEARCILQRHLPLGSQSAGSRVAGIKLVESNRVSETSINHSQQVVTRSCIIKNMRQLKMKTRPFNLTSS